MSGDALTDLLEDATLVALYGQRAGRLRDNSLFTAIQKARAEQRLDWGNPVLIELQSALNSAVQSIYPVTLIDLKNGFDPFAKLDKRGRATARRSNVGFVIAAFALVLLCAYYTIWYQRATLLLESLSKVKSGEQIAIIHETFFPLFDDDRSEMFKQLENPNSLSSVAIREKIERLRLIDKSMQENKRIYNEISISLHPMNVIYYHVLAWITSIPNPVSDADASGKSAQESPPATSSGYGIDASSCSRDQRRAKMEDQSTNADDQSLLQVRKNIVQYDKIVSQIRCLVGLTTSTEEGSFLYSDKAAKDLSQTNEVLGHWVLPSLYGALGALTYYMRSILNPLQPNPNLGRVLLRISLSAFAGISVAWFWSPSLLESVGAGELPLGILTIAFLIGFSIDVFFALLDRLVTLATASIGRLGSASNG